MFSNIDEKSLSHIPAVKALMAFGYELLNQEELKKKRVNPHNILLEDILIKKIKELNKNKIDLDDKDAKKAVYQLMDIKNSGLVKTNEEVYDLLTLGANIKKDFKSYNLKYIDWQEPENNTYHVAFEVPVKNKMNIERECDIVLFVNGIPFVVIENKSPSESLDEAIFQHIRNQRSDEIPQLFYYAQILIAVNKNKAKYATIDSSKDYWSIWREEEKQNIDIIRNLINIPLPKKEKKTLYTGDFASYKDHFNQQELAGTIEPTEQDKILYALCRPERLLDLIANFCVFDNAVRKIARHHQFFATHAAAKRIQQHDEYHIRKGGIIWHTQGTGKSLTMILIAKFLLKSNDTENLRIIIITDRTELDEQIKNAFKNCGFEPKNAISSEHLIKCNASVITSLIHKFNTAFKKEFQDLNNNILVFVDECHRTQHGDLANKMRAILPNACYIGFTGTPLFKEYKNTMEKFGGSIHNYTLKDNIIVKLFYEGRIIQQHLNDEISINKNFDTITNDLDEKQKTALKRRFSHPTTLSNTEKTIYAKAADISTHYSKTFKGTGLKGMLIAPSRAIAIRFKKILDQIGQVNSEVVISSFDERKGNTDIRSKNEIQEFLTTQKGLKSNHHKITKEFNSDDGPEILIVVSKLLTGFDAPRNTVVYICKKLKEHTLLQAISRINRLFEKNEKTKEYGYIIDYEGLRVALNNAYKTYENHNIQNFNIRNLEKLNKEDLEDTIFFVDDKIQELFPSLQEIKDIFTNVPNSLDPEQIEQHLADENIRSNFYFLLDKFKNLMSIASNSNKLCQVFSIEQLAELQNGLKNFDKLKKIVEKRYNEKTDKKIYTDQIAKLLDEHIIAGDIIKTDMVNIFDNQILEHFITRVDITDVDKANQINAQLQDVINYYISADPALSRKFSELINSTITQHHYKRLSDSDFLNKSINIINEFKKDVPTELNNNKTIIAFYRKLLNFLQNQTGQDQRENTIKIALDMYEIIKNKKVIHWTINSKVINEMKKSLNNYFFDVVKNEMRIDFNTKNLSNLTDSLIDLAIEHES